MDFSSKSDELQTIYKFHHHIHMKYVLPTSVQSNKDARQMSVC